MVLQHLVILKQKVQICEWLLFANFWEPLLVLVRMGQYGSNLFFFDTAVPLVLLRRSLPFFLS